MSYRKMSIWCVASLVLLVVVCAAAEERVEFKRPAVGSFAWQEMSITTAPVGREPDPPDHSSQAAIVVRHHDDGGIDMMGHSQSGLAMVTIVRLDREGHIVRGMVFPPKHEIHGSEAALVLYPQIPGGAALVGESWTMEYRLDQDHRLKGKMQVKGQITMQKERPWWVIDFSWEGNVHGILGQPNPDPEKPMEFEHRATGKYVMDSVTSMVLPLQATMVYQGFMTLTMETESLEFGMLPEAAIPLLQQAYDALEQDRLDDAETALQHVSETVPEIPWLAGMSDGVKMPDTDSRP